MIALYGALERLTVLLWYEILFTRRYSPNAAMSAFVIENDSTTGPKWDTKASGMVRFFDWLIMIVSVELMSGLCLTESGTYLKLIYNNFRVCYVSLPDSFLVIKKYVLQPLHFVGF